MHQDATWYGGSPQPKRLGTKPPTPKGVESPNFRPTSVVAKRLHGSMPLGTEVGLGLRDIVFDVDPATPGTKRAHLLPPNFYPMSIVAKRLDG